MGHCNAGYRLSAGESGRSGSKIHVVVFGLDRPVAPQRIFRTEADHQSPAVFAAADREAVDTAARKLGRHDAEGMLFVRKGQSTLGIDEPAICRQTGPSSQRQEAVDFRSRRSDRLESNNRTAEGKRLRSIEVRPRSIEFKAEHQAGNLLVDADLPATEETPWGKIETLVVPVRHPAAVTGVNADIGAAPVVIGRGRERPGFHRQVGGKNGSSGQNRAKRGRDQPKPGFLIGHSLAPSGTRQWNRFARERCIHGATPREIAPA